MHERVAATWRYRSFFLFKRGLRDGRVSAGRLGVWWTRVNRPSTPDMSSPETPPFWAATLTRSRQLSLPPTVDRLLHATCVSFLLFSQQLAFRLNPPPPPFLFFTSINTTRNRVDSLSWAASFPPAHKNNSECHVRENARHRASSTLIEAAKQNTTSSSHYWLVNARIVREREREGGHISLFRVYRLKAIWFE